MKPTMESILTGKQKVKNMIYRVGIELEGGWRSLPKGVTLQHDGSVNVVDEGENPVVRIPEPQIAPTSTRNSSTGVITRNSSTGGITTTTSASTAKRSTLQIGELPSDPLEPDKVEVWMRKYYPHVVNASCGMHVHMSFKSALNYARLMVPEATDVMVQWVSRWGRDEGLAMTHPLWNRLEGRSPYCQNKFYAEEQVRTPHKDFDRHRNGNRYTILNYCYRRNGTLECRLLPMMDTVDQGIRAVNRVLAITNAFLLCTAKREEKMEAVTKAEPDFLNYRNNITSTIRGRHQEDESTEI